MNFLKRLSEPSTHAGIAALLQVGKTFAPQYAGVIDGFTVLFGALAALVPEGTASK
ncbi:MAG TPA: hypothetical protein VMH83_06220 [Candidatus Acidoferrum sp.]|nr:hypothetical protein [Candidatus Acidoferrum sp.]